MVVKENTNSFLRWNMCRGVCCQRSNPMPLELASRRMSSASARSLLICLPVRIILATVIGLGLF